MGGKSINCSTSKNRGLIGLQLFILCYRVSTVRSQTSILKDVLEQFSETSEFINKELEKSRIRVNDEQKRWKLSRYILIFTKDPEFYICVYFPRVDIMIDK